MEKDNRKYRICFIDYMWYVAEIWHERERTNLNGRMLRPTHTAWGSADIAPFRLDDWFGHSDSSLLSSRFILQATLYSRTA